MSASYYTFFEIKGKPEDIISILSVIKTYANGNFIYFDSIMINNKNKFYCKNSGELNLEKLSKEELMSFVGKAKGKIYVSALGPFGEFGTLDEVELFERMAEVATDAYFLGNMSGKSAGAEESLEGVLSCGELTIKFNYPKDDPDNFDSIDKEKFDLIKKYDPVSMEYVLDSDSTLEPQTLQECVTFIMENKEKLPSNRGYHLNQAIRKTMPYKDFLITFGFDKTFETKKLYDNLTMSLSNHGKRYDDFCKIIKNGWNKEQFNAFYDNLLSLPCAYSPLDDKG